MNLIKKILYVYFTNYPYLLYHKSNNYGNLALSGIGLGLIDSQRMFWISNSGMAIFIFSRNYVNLYHMNIFICLTCGFLYGVSLIKTIKLLKYIYFL